MASLDDLLVACGGDENVDLVHDILDSNNTNSIHAGCKVSNVPMKASAAFDYFDRRSFSHSKAKNSCKHLHIYMQFYTLCMKDFLTRIMQMHIQFEFANNGIIVEVVKALP